MKSKTKETLMILQEECAEVIQACSKIYRFGFESRYPTEKSPTTTECLETEIGDLLCMIQILVEQEVISEVAMMEAMENKREKLKVWSKIFDATDNT